MTRSWKRAILALAKEYGCTVEIPPGHLKLRHPDGWQVTVSCSPRDYTYALSALRRDLERKRRGIYK